MQPTDKRAFKDALDLAYETVRQPLPSPGVLTVFWASLETFPLDAVLRAISRHVQVSEFAPTPAAILKHLPRRGDGHIEADEAWTIAIRALDERNTVVWTPQIAQAWHSVDHVAHGDEIAARMAFRATYTRILDDARAAGTPAVWSPALGWDVEQREQVVGEAVRCGRLALSVARAAVPMLAGPEAEPSSDGAAQQIAKLGLMVAGIGSARDRALAARSVRTREEAEQVSEQKRSIAARVADYQRSHA